MDKINSSGAYAEIFRTNLANNMAVRLLAPCFVKSSVDMVYVWDILKCHEVWFLLFSNIFYMGLTEPKCKYKLFVYYVIH